MFTAFSVGVLTELSTGISGFSAHLHMRYAVFEKFFRCHFKAFFGIKSDGVCLCFEVQAFSAIVQARLPYPLMEQSAAKTCAAFGGYDSAYLYCMGFIGLDEQPQAGGTFALVVQREEVSADKVDAVHILTGTVLFYYKNVLPRFHYCVYLSGSEVIKFFGDDIIHLPAPALS